MGKIVGQIELWNLGKATSIEEGKHWIQTSCHHYHHHHHVALLARISPDPLTPPVSIVHRSREVFQTSSCIGTELLYIGSSLSSKLCLSMWRDPQEYIAYEFVLTSPAGSACLVGLIWLVFVMGGWCLFCRVLPPGLVQYSSQNSWVIPVKLFLHTFC